MEKTLQSFKKDKNLFIGFYGGSNYGDELLMEVIMNFNELHSIKGDFFYFNRVPYKDFHLDFSKSRILFSMKELLKSTLTSKNIIFGGGGIFSEDGTIKHIVLIIYLLFLKVFLFKRIYFIGFGIYNTPESLGFKKLIKMGIYKSKYFTILIQKTIKFIAKKIIVRDITSFNLLSPSKKLSLDEDIVFLLKKYDFSKSYDLKNIKITREEKIYIFDKLIEQNGGRKIILFSLRKLNQTDDIGFDTAITDYIIGNPNKIFLFWDTFSDEKYLSMENFKKLKNVYLFNNTNPLSIYYFLMSKKDSLYIASPQFHGVLTAYLNGIDFLGLYYAPKGIDLLNYIGKKGKHIIDVDKKYLDKEIKI